MTTSAAAPEIRTDGLRCPDCGRLFGELGPDGARCRCGTAVPRARQGEAAAWQTYRAERASMRQGTGDEPANITAGELAELKAEMDRLRKERDEARAARRAGPCEDCRLTRRVLADTGLSDGEKIAALALADVTAAWERRPPPAGPPPGSVRLDLRPLAVAAGCTKQTISKNVKKLQRTGALAVTAETSRKVAPDPATGERVVGFTTKLHATPRATGPDLLRAIVNRTYAPPDEKPLTKPWKDGRCRRHPDAAVKVISVTTYRCSECGAKVREDRARECMRSNRSDSERCAPAATVQIVTPINRGLVINLRPRGGTA